MYTQADTESIEARVNAILEKFGIDAPPVPVQDIAVGLGLQVVKIAIQNSVSGALINVPDSPSPVIAVNEAQHLNRQRFTIAHELGHFLLGHLSKDSLVDREFVVFRRDDSLSSAKYSDEIRANRFAAELLMPVKFLVLDIDAEEKISADRLARLAKKYIVSEIAMTHRLGNLGLLPPT